MASGGWAQRVQPPLFCLPPLAGALQLLLNGRCPRPPGFLPQVRRDWGPGAPAPPPAVSGGSLLLPTQGGRPLLSGLALNSIFFPSSPRTRCRTYHDVIPISCLTEFPNVVQMAKVSLAGVMWGGAAVGPPMDRVPPSPSAGLTATSACFGATQQSGGSQQGDCCGSCKRSIFGPRDRIWSGNGQSRPRNGTGDTNSSSGLSRPAGRSAALPLASVLEGHNAGGSGGCSTPYQALHPWCSPCSWCAKM